MPGPIDDFFDGLAEAEEQSGDGWWEYGHWHTTWREGLAPQSIPPVMITWARSVPGPTVLPGTDITAAEVMDWVAAAEPRNPFVPVLDPAPTPVPKRGPVPQPPDHPAPSGGGPSGKAKPALKKRKATEVVSGEPISVYLHSRGRVYRG